MDCFRRRVRVDDEIVEQVSSLGPKIKHSRWLCFVFLSQKVARLEKEGALLCYAEENSPVDCFRRRVRVDDEIVEQVSSLGPKTKRSRWLCFVFLSQKVARLEKEGA